MAGWGFDPNLPAQSIDMHVYVGGPAGSIGAQGFAVRADANRPDVASAYPAAGAGHGFDATRETSKRGPQSVYVYAINVPGTPGGNVLLGTRTVNLGYSPLGNFDLTSSPQPGMVRVAGWAFDPNLPAQAIDVHVYVGGPAGSGAPGFPLRADRKSVV